MFFNLNVYKVEGKCLDKYIDKEDGNKEKERVLAFDYVVLGQSLADVTKNIEEIVEGRSYIITKTEIMGQGALMNSEYLPKDKEEETSAEDVKEEK